MLQVMQAVLYQERNIGSWSGKWLHFLNMLVVSSFIVVMYDKPMQIALLRFSRTAYFAKACLKPFTSGAIDLGWEREFSN